MIKFPSIIKNQYDLFAKGKDVWIDPAEVAAIEPQVYTFRNSSSQNYAVARLKSGATIEVFADSESLAKAIEAATAQIRHHPSTPAAEQTPAEVEIKMQHARTAVGGRRPLPPLPKPPQNVLIRDNEGKTRPKNGS